MDTKTTKSKKKIVILSVVLGILVILLAFIAFYGYMAMKYSKTFYPHTVINNIDYSGMTPEEVEKNLIGANGEYTLTIKFRNDQTETLSGADFQYSYILDGSVYDFLEEQNPFLWIIERGKSHEYSITGSPVYDKEQLTALVEALPELQSENMEAPVDAELVYENNQYTVTPHSEGTTLIPSQVVDAVADAVANRETEIDIDALGLYQEPQNRSDEGSLLTTQAQQLNEWANAHITYTLPDGSTMEVTPDLLKSWLVQNADGTYTKNDDYFNQQIKAFLREMGEKVDNVKKERLFDSTNNGTITIPVGEYNTYGYETDEAAEAEVLKQLINEHQFVTKEPEYLHREKGTENHGLGTTYLEINLTAQHLWFYKDGQLAFETDNIVSGKMTTWRYTPPGAYRIANKELDHIMKGTNSKGEVIYETPCDYWMLIIPELGIGLHDAEANGVRTNWSKTAYINNGSHGCINMKDAEAAQLYSMLDTGTPVIMYYTEPYDLVPEEG